MKLKQLASKLVLAVSIFVFTFSAISTGLTAADSFNPNNIIDDGVFDSSTSMSAGDINNFLNTFSGSCISPNNGFQAPDPTGYSPTGGFTYGGQTTAGQVIADASLAYGLNPQVMLTTLEKEQSLVTGGAGCSTLRYTGAAGYGCPDGGTQYSYSNVDLYSLHGVETTSVSGTCVNTAAKAGFSQQVIHSAWLLKFGEQRSEGNIGWDVQHTNYPQSGDNWNNSDDPQSCYGGPMTSGTFQTCPGGSSTFYDGYTTIDGSSTQMQTGATASLYWYTPHFSGNQHFFTIFTNWFGSTSSCNYGKGQTAPPTNAFGNPATLAGHWTGGSTEGLLYLTPNASGGFEVGTMAPGTGSSGLQWRGTWWSQTNPNIDLGNTVFIPVNSSNGYTDLYYATSTNWSKPGFTVGLMANTGSGFSYQGTKWSSSSLSLANTRFIPGNWTSTTQGDIAYATPNASGGFDLGVMDPSTSGLQWRGTWWNQNNGNIDLGNTTFIPADSNGDGYTDLYYASNTNWSNPGFTVGLMANSSHSLTWQGSQWNNTSLALNTVKFIPGNWTSTTSQGFAYTTQCGTRGFNLGVMAPGTGNSGLQWRGTWWAATTLPYTSTDFIPADTDGDGYTDLYYATPAGSGFSVGLQHNSAGGAIGWGGTQWSPTSIPLNSTLFLP